MGDLPPSVTRERLAEYIGAGAQEGHVHFLPPAPSNDRCAIVYAHPSSARWLLANSGQAWAPWGRLVRAQPAKQLAGEEAVDRALALVGRLRAELHECRGAYLAMQLEELVQAFAVREPGPHWPEHALHAKRATIVMLSLIFTNKVAETRHGRARAPRGRGTHAHKSTHHTTNVTIHGFSDSPSAGSERHRNEG